jgi:hypothetical protein
VLQTGLQGGESESILMNSEGEIYQLKTEYAKASQIQEVILSQSSPVPSPYNYSYGLVNLVSLDLMVGSCTDITSHNLHTALDIFRHLQYPRAYQFVMHTSQT